MAEFEFTAEHEKHFGELAGWLNWYSILQIAAGVLVVAVAAFMLQGADGNRALPGFGIGIAMIVIGFVFRRPIDNLKNIMNTEGRDVAELMVAIKDFSQAFLAASVATGLFLLMVIARLLFVATG